MTPTTPFSRMNDMTKDYKVTDDGKLVEDEDENQEFSEMNFSEDEE